eukprot:5675730-Amphidinium_carterae.1
MSVVPVVGGSEAEASGLMRKERVKKEPKSALRASFEVALATHVAAACGCYNSTFACRWTFPAGSVCSESEHLNLNVILSQGMKLCRETSEFLKKPPAGWLE